MTTPGTPYFPTTGYYTLMAVPIGTHRVRWDPSSGRRLSSPSSGQHVVSISSGAIASDKAFGLTQMGLLSGIVWLDSDRDGSRDLVEQGLGNVRVYLDANGNAQYDSGEASVFTSNQTGLAGNYTINVASGAQVLRVASPPSTSYTVPKSGYYSISVGSGATYTRNFGISP